MEGQVRHQRARAEKTIPKNVASSGTGARLARVSGPRTETLTRPRSSQRTSSPWAVATDVIRSSPSPLLLRHTRSMYGESDG
ncbi:hypothetical protein ACFSTC_52985 [Nonomuraea ferruginea]